MKLNWKSYDKPGVFSSIYTWVKVYHCKQALDQSNKWWLIRWLKPLPHPTPKFWGWRGLNHTWYSWLWFLVMLTKDTTGSGGIEVTSSKRSVLPSWRSDILIISGQFSVLNFNTFRKNIPFLFCHYAYVTITYIYVIPK